MTSQRQLNGEIAGIDEAVVFYRSVKSEQRLIKPNEQTIGSPSDLNEVEELMDNIKQDKLDYSLPLADSGMEGMRSDRVIKVLESGAKGTFVEDLLGIFCESLKGRQRAKNKFAMLIYLGGSFLLAHVKAERGLSIREEEGEQDDKIELIRRFLDVDNILSAALFERNDDHEIRFSHFTDSGSDSFRDFLGVHEHHLNYRRKTIQILCYYRGRREYDCKFEFTKDEFSDKWLRDQALQFSGNELRFEEDGRDGAAHEINEIRWGKDSYDSVESFKSDFKEQSLGINIEKDRYGELTRYPSESGAYPSVYQPDAKDAVDYRRKVEIEKESGEKEGVKKGRTPDDLHVLYAGNHIRLASSFADDIFHDLMNENDIRIYHASEAPAPRALNIANITFLTIDERAVSDERLQFLEEIYLHAVNRTGETISKCLINSMLHALRMSADPQLENALGQLVNIYSGNPTDGATISTKENEGPNFVEYKNRQHLENGDPASKIIDEIQTEMRKGNGTKIFLWGFTEQSRQIDGLSTQSWGDDRISNIEDRVQEQLSEENIEYNEYIMQPVNLDRKGGRIAVTGIFF